MLPNFGRAAKAAYYRKSFAVSLIHNLLRFLTCCSCAWALTALAEDATTAPTPAAESAVDNAPAPTLAADTANTAAAAPSQPPQEFKQSEWPFRPLARPAVPELKRLNSWPHNSIDNFIAAKLEAAKLEPNSPADKTTLLRRVTFDLTGLPPTPTEQPAFL